MVPICCPETSVRNYHYLLRSNPEERSFLVCEFSLLRPVTLKLQKPLSILLSSIQALSFQSSLTERQLWTLSALVFLRAFEKLRKATVSFVTSVCPSVRPHGITRLPLDGFS